MEFYYSVFICSKNDGNVERYEVVARDGDEAMSDVLHWVGEDSYSVLKVVCDGVVEGDEDE